MATVTTSWKAAPAVTAVAPYAPFGSMLEEQRAECVRRRELALQDTGASVPDPVAMARSAQLLRTMEEIDAALARSRRAPTAGASLAGAPCRWSGWSFGRVPRPA
jgi:hypothetical protein